MTDNRSNERSPKLRQGGERPSRPRAAARQSGSDAAGCSSRLPPLGQRPGRGRAVALLVLALLLGAANLGGQSALPDEHGPTLRIHVYPWSKDNPHHATPKDAIKLVLPDLDEFPAVWLNMGCARAVEGDLLHLPGGHGFVMDVLIYDTAGELAYDTRELGAFEGSQWRANCYIAGRSVREGFSVSILPRHAKRIYELAQVDALGRVEFPLEPLGFGLPPGRYSWGDVEVVSYRRPDWLLQSVPALPLAGSVLLASLLAGVSRRLKRRVR